MASTAVLAAGARARRAALLAVVTQGPGGLVRLAGLTCFILVLALRGPTDAGLFALVLAGLVLPVAGPVGPRLDAAHGVAILVAAWCGVLGLYERVLWLDAVMHLVVPGLVAAVAHLVLARQTGAMTQPDGDAPRATRTGSVLVTTSLGLALAVVWEVAEYLGNAYLDPAIFVAYGDTIGDLVLGGVGAAVAGVLLLRTRRSGGEAPSA